MSEELDYNRYDSDNEYEGGNKSKYLGVDYGLNHIFNRRPR